MRRDRRSTDHIEAIVSICNLATGRDNDYIERHGRVRLVRHDCMLGNNAC